MSAKNENETIVEHSKNFTYGGTDMGEYGGTIK